jgi:hypothetical protein
MYYNAGIVAVKSEAVILAPEVNPTIASYSVSAVKIYDTAVALVAFVRQNIIYALKTSLRTVTLVL